MKLEGELVAESRWEEREQEGSPSWGLSPGERPSGQRVVGGASTCQAVGTRGRGGGEHSVRCKRHQ